MFWALAPCWASAAGVASTNAAAAAPHRILIGSSSSGVAKDGNRTRMPCAHGHAACGQGGDWRSQTIAHLTLGDSVMFKTLIAVAVAGAVELPMAVQASGSGNMVLA